MLPYQQQYQGNYTAFQNGSYQPQPQYQHPGQPLPEVYIELNTKQKAGVRNLVNPKEKIFYAGLVPKINQAGKAQDRILVITNKTVYNIDPNEGFFSGLALCSTPTFTVKRRIDMSRINAITVSVNPTSDQQQFVIHVRGGHDYRYKGLKNRERIVKSFFNAHFANTLEPLALFCREEIELAKFQTSEEDVKAKKTKRPQNDQILVTAEHAAKVLEWIVFNRRFLASMSNARHSGPQQFNNYYPQGPMNGGYNNNYPGPYGHQNQGPSFPQQGGYPVGGYGFPQQGGQFDPRYSHPSDQGRPSTNQGKPQYYVPEFQPQQINTQPQGYQQEQRPSNQNQNHQGHNNFNYPQPPTQPVNNNSPQFKGIEANMQPYGNPNQNVQINTFTGQGPQNNYPQPQGNKSPQNNAGNYGYYPRY